MPHSFVLIGLPGVGKTTVGKMLSDRLASPFVDTDTLIEQRMNCTIPEIFAKYGEDYFREVETSVIKDLPVDVSQIVAIGGGAFQKEANRLSLKQLGKIIYLKALPEDIFERLKEDGSRPLLQCSSPFEKIRELYLMRKDAFELADIIVDTTNLSEQEVLEKILRLI